MILVTGGAGFIGSNFILDWLANPEAESILNLDNLTYAGNLSYLRMLNHDKRYTFIKGDICDFNFVQNLLKKFHITKLINFAAETHVDRSITTPSNFIQTNIIGTFNLLEAARTYLEYLPNNQRNKFRFLHVSTDEVFGTLLPAAPAFLETNPYMPNNPYSASKASSNHLVRAWHKTYGLPVITTNCSNNYGPNQFPEKLIPLIIFNALSGKLLPIYGDGQQIRDWLYVKDHCLALSKILKLGKVGDVYNIGGWNERSNLQVVLGVCSILDELKPRVDGRKYAEQIKHVEDRVGHDKRYAIDSSKLKFELDWSPTETFESGLLKTVKWYLDNELPVIN